MSLGEYALPTSIVLIGVIVLFESFRQKKGFKIDFIFSVNIIYIICFGIVPLSINIIDLTYYPSTHRIRYLDLGNTAFFLASIVSLLGYFCIIIGYYFAKKYRLNIRKKNNIKKITSHTTLFPRKKIAMIAFILFFIGLLSLLIYVHSIGGIIYALETAALYRSGRGPVSSKFLFLKNIAPLVLVASYMFFALYYTSNNKKKKKFMFWFIISLIVSFYLLLLLSGRLTIVRYLVVFPLFIVLYKGRGALKFGFVSIVSSLIVIIFGNALFRAFNKPEEFLSYVTSWNLQLEPLLKDLLLEFSFPFINLVHLLTAYRDISYRFFSDIYIGILQLLPQSLLGLETPSPLSSVNTEYFGTLGRGTVPVDLLSFGYYSFNIPGVIIVTFLFGVVLCWFDRVFPPGKSAIESIFRSAWIIFLAFRVMYGDPSLIAQGVFELLTATLCLYLFRSNNTA